MLEKRKRNENKKIIGGVLSCLMLCGLLVGCSGSNNSSSNSNYKKGTVTESKFTSEWMGIQYTLPNDMTMLSEETIASGSKDNIQVEMQAYLTDAPSTKKNIGMLAEDISKDTSMDENKYIELTKLKWKRQYRVSHLVNKEKRTIAGQEFYELPYSYTKDVNGTQTTITQTFLCKKIEDRMVCITLTYPDQENNRPFVIRLF